jgi:hypothetical protein
MKVYELLSIIKKDQKVSLITNNPTPEDWDRYDGYPDEIPYKYVNADVEYIESGKDVLNIKTNFQDKGRGYDY